MKTVRDIRAWQLCVLTSRELSAGRFPATVVRAAVAGGADVIQFRDKDAPARVLFDTAAALRDICREAGVAFVVNDRLDLALAVEADGLHVGQDDLPASVARRLLGRGQRLGVSVGSVAEAEQAIEDGADYLGAGPVFDARSSKPDAGAPIGLETLSEICRHSAVPVLAIGGIRAQNAASVMAAGAVGVAVISAVVSAPDIEQSARALKRIVTF